MFARSVRSVFNGIRIRAKPFAWFITQSIIQRTRAQPWQPKKWNRGLKSTTSVFASASATIVAQPATEINKEDEFEPKWAEIEFKLKELTELALLITAKDLEEDQKQSNRKQTFFSDLSPNQTAQVQNVIANTKEGYHRKIQNLKQNYLNARTLHEKETFEQYVSMLHQYVLPELKNCTVSSSSYPSGTIEMGLHLKQQFPAVFDANSRPKISSMSIDNLELDIRAVPGLFNNNIVKHYKLSFVILT